MFLKNKNIYIPAGISAIILLVFLIIFLIKTNNILPSQSIVNKTEISKTINLDISNPQKIENIANYLIKWNNYYNEKENSKKALNILKDMEDTYETLYYKWYANEIVANYDMALSFYNKALEVSNIDNIKKSLLYTQIWHIHDLQWDSKNANIFYVKSEELWENIISTLINRWRYEYRLQNYDSAERYFNKALEQNIDNFINSELYFNLATIYQNKNDWLDKAIEYANLGIQIQKDYPNNYLSLWISYIMKWWEDIDKSVEQFEKTISLHKDSSRAYKYLWIYYYIKNDFDNAIKNFELQLEKSPIDIILMKNEKNIMKNDAIYDLSKAYALKWDAQKSMKYLNQILNWENRNYYTTFLREFSIEDWAYKSILITDTFKNNLVEIIKLYK